MNLIKINFITIIILKNKIIIKSNLIKTNFIISLIRLGWHRSHRRDLVSDDSNKFVSCVTDETGRSVNMFYCFDISRGRSDSP